MTAVERLARELTSLRRDVRSLQTQPQLAYSSIEDGAVQGYDANGNLVITVGKQWDGTSVVSSFNGPKPPACTPPTATASLGGAVIAWDGNWPNNGIAPMDFARVEVHVSDQIGFDPSFATTLRATIESPRGGTITVALPYSEHEVVFVVRSLSGKASDPSARTRVTPLKILAADIDESLNLGGTTVFYGTDTPTGAVGGDLWLKAPENVAYRLQPDGWVPVQDQGIVQALQDAQEAAQAANQAGVDALAAQTAADSAQDAADAATGLAQLAQQTADKKVVAYRQSSAPTGLAAGDVNDLWVDSDDGKLYVWSGSAWVLSDDQRIATALSTANAAQTAVATKATIFRQTSAPSTTGRVAGDLWIDSDDSNKVYVWTGAWTISDDQRIATALTNASNAQLAADAKVAVYRQTSAPTGLVASDANDLWLDTDDGNKLYAWSGTAWVLSQDTAIQTALTNAGTAQTTANSKVTVFFQTSAPSTTGRVNGDIWLDSDDSNKRYVWNGAWTASPVGASGISATARQLGSTTIYKQASAPTSGMLVNDYWIDNDDGNKPYIYNGTAWELSQDAAINTAVTNATAAQTAAASKVRVLTSNANDYTLFPTGTTAGDLLIALAFDNRMYRWDGTQWLYYQFGNAAIQPKSLVARDVIATGTISGSLLEATMVLGSTIRAGTYGTTGLVDLNGNGISAWGPPDNSQTSPYAGKQTFNLRASDGAATIVGTIRTAFVAAGEPFVTLSSNVRYSSATGSNLAGIELNRGDQISTRGGWDSALYNFKFPDQDGATYLSSWEAIRQGYVKTDGTTSQGTGRTDLRISPSAWHLGSDTAGQATDLGGRKSYISSYRSPTAESPAQNYINIESGSFVRLRTTYWGIGHASSTDPGRTSIFADNNGIITATSGGFMHASLYANGELMLRNTGSRVTGRAPVNGGGGRLIGEWRKSPTAGSTAGYAGVLASGYIHEDDFWFSWENGEIRIWVNDQPQVRITANVNRVI